jgi:hypothetical protein
MYRKIFKFAVMTITILLVNLITTKITDYFISYRVQYKPITFSLIAMAIITLIFYPLFTNLEDWVNEISVKIFRSGKMLGSKYIGLLLIFFICLSILLYFYTKMYYNVDLINILFQGKIGSQF